MSAAFVSTTGCVYCITSKLAHQNMGRGLNQLLLCLLLAVSGVLAVSLPIRIWVGA